LSTPWKFPARSGDTAIVKSLVFRKSAG
jgi:hypothetical protein